MIRFEHFEVLILPGLENSGPDHWQSHWEREHGFSRVFQTDWFRPLPQTWNATLETAVLEAQKPVVLVGHSMGAVTIASWAASSGSVTRVKAALLVAPADTEKPGTLEPVAAYGPVPTAQLPFRSRLVASTDDPWMALERSKHFATLWNAQLTVLESAGHINVNAGFGPWPQGIDLLSTLLETL